MSYEDLNNSIGGEITKVPGNEIAGMLGVKNNHLAVYVISIAAELSGMHPQTLRQYDRVGILTPGRSRGGVRLYSDRDLSLLLHIQELASVGINLAGIKRILELESELARLSSDK